jgi:hypothetical protein
LLTLARTDGRTEAAAKKDVNIVKLVQKRADLIRARLDGKELEIDAPEELK